MTTVFSASPSLSHAPVMLEMVLEVLALQAGQVVFDGTFGAGGYSRAFLERGAHVLALDKDPTAVAAGHEELCRLFPKHLILQQGCFSQAVGFIQKFYEKIDAFVLDLGVSSMQLDQAERGFSFMRDGPLDMRMGEDGPTAADLVNQAPEEELRRIFRELGEERRAAAAARAVCRARVLHPFTRTKELADVLARAVGPLRAGRLHPATRCFQALRLAVNDELGELEKGLQAAQEVLRPGGRLVVVAFHSLEDRIVKNFLRGSTGEIVKASRHLPPQKEQEDTRPFEVCFKGVRKPSVEEVARNPRARSARLRCGIRRAP